MFNQIVLCLVIGCLVADRCFAQDDVPKLDNGVVTQLENSKDFYEHIRMKSFFDFEDTEIAEVVNERYAKKGITFLSFNKDDSVSTQLYTFAGGRGGMKCIANRKPTYAGKMKINFDVGPNRMRGVSKVGFLLAHVSKNGTFVEAYGAGDKKLGVATVLKSKQGTAFIGLESTKPIMYVMIVPNPAIDEDFALDDLAFESCKDAKKK